MPKAPTRAGLYWAVLDDGVEVVEIVPLRLMPYEGSPIEDGIWVDFCDGSRRFAEMQAFDQTIIRPSQRTVVVMPGTTSGREVRITWLGEIKPPRSAPKVGDLCDP